MEEDQWHRINPEHERKGGLSRRDGAGRVAAVSIRKGGVAGSPLTNRTRRPLGPSIRLTSGQ